MRSKNNSEYVVLVNDKNEEIEQELKSQVHTKNTPLHRGFSSYVFNSRGDLLLQQRSATKKTWPLIWSNSCCGHPSPGETSANAVRRRLGHELGIKAGKLWNILPDYQYRFELHGIVENEICPVFVTFNDQQLDINPNEVAAIRWVSWQKFQQEVMANNSPYSPWCIEQVGLLQNNDELRQLLSEHTVGLK